MLEPLASETCDDRVVPPILLQLRMLDSEMTKLFAYVTRHSKKRNKSHSCRGHTTRSSHPTKKTTEQFKERISESHRRDYHRLEPSCRFADIILPQVPQAFTTEAVGRFLREAHSHNSAVPDNFHPAMITFLALLLYEPIKILLQMTVTMEAPPNGSRLWRYTYYGQFPQSQSPTCCVRCTTALLGQ